MEQALQSQSPSWAQPMVSKADCCQRRQPLLRPSRAGSRHRGVSRFTPSPWPRNQAAGTDVLALPPGCPVPSLWTPAPRSKSHFLRWVLFPCLSPPFPCFLRGSKGRRLMPRQTRRMRRRPGAGATPCPLGSCVLFEEPLSFASGMEGPPR